MENQKDKSTEDKEKISFVYEVNGKSYAKGNKGIMELLHCSIGKAKALKGSGKIADSVIQDGRHFIVDVERFFELLKEKKAGRKLKTSK